MSKQRLPRKAKKNLKKTGNWFFQTNGFGYITVTNIDYFNKPCIQRIKFNYHAPYDGYITTKITKKWIKTTYTK